MQAGNIIASVSTW